MLRKERSSGPAPRNRIQADRLSSKRAIRRLFSSLCCLTTGASGAQDCHTGKASSKICLIRAIVGMAGIEQEVTQTMRAAISGFLRQGLARSGGLSREQLTRVRDLAIAVLGLADDVIVKVNEINCVDPACPGQETIILIMAPGQRSRALKIRAPVESVDAAAITQAVAEADGAEG
jgi:hypothetical protein